MGGKNKQVVVGHNYFWGLHVIPCAAPIDGVVEFSVDEREAWAGSVGQGSITVNSLQLFGGNEREGGIGGYIDVESGTPEVDANNFDFTVREPNAYLKQVLANGYYDPGLSTSYSQPTTNPGLVSAFEGFFQLIFRRFYWGNLPRQKGWRVVLKNIYSTQPEMQNSGAFNEQPISWMPMYAPVCPEYRIGDVNVYFALDNSGSMSVNSFSPFSPGRHQQVREAMNNALDLFAASADEGSEIALRMCVWGQTEQASFERIPFTSADLAAAKAWVDGYSTTSDFTYYNSGVENAPQFFSDADVALLGADQLAEWETAGAGDTSRIEDRNIVPGRERHLVFVSDGFATNFDSVTEAVAIRDSIPGVQLHGVGIGSIGDINFLDNTQGSVVSDSTGQSLAEMLKTPWMSRGDLNAAHILRHILIGTNCGGTGDWQRIGPSFETAAALFHEECMGFSFYWDKNRMTRDEFRKHVEAHAGCKVYMDRTTGLWEINPIRPNYVVENLPTIDENMIVEWIDYKYPRQSELPNQITLTYTNRTNGKPAAISRTNTAAVQSVTPPRIRNQNVGFDGITNPELAEKIVMRELAARTVPLRTGQVRLAYLPADMYEGDAFVLSDSRLGISGVVCRLEETDDTDGKDNSVIIRFTQDFYRTDPTNDPVTGTDDIPTTGTVDYTPQPSTTHFLEEANYYDLATTLGESQLTTDLANDDGLGVWQFTGNRPTNWHQSADIALNTATNTWLNVVSTSLMPIWTLTNTLSAAADDTIFVCDMTGREYDLRVGQMIQIGGERMRVDSVVVNVGAGKAIFTVGRGCLDTVPAEHAAGSIVMGWEFFVGSTGDYYTHGETVNLRLLPKTIQGTLAIGQATTQSYTFASRASRPYPVGKLQLDGSYLPADELSGTVTVTWAHRNRLTQTSEVIQDHTDDNITPESGISLKLVRRLIDSTDGSVMFFDETAIGSPESTTTTNTDLSTLSPYADATVLEAEIGIETSRGADPVFTNWQTPFVRFPFSPLASPPPPYLQIDPYWSNVAVLYRFNGNDGSFHLPANEGFSVLELTQRSTNDKRAFTSAYQTLHYNTALDFQDAIYGIQAENPSGFAGWAEDVGIQDQFGSQTIDGWFYVNDLSNSPYTPTVFFGTGGMEKSGTTLIFDDWGWNVFARHDGRLCMVVTTGTGGVQIMNIESTAGQIPIGSWFHLAAVRSGLRDWTLYVNGSPVVTGSQAGAMTTGPVFADGRYWDVATEFFIGGAQQIGILDSEHWLNGYCDSVRWTIDTARWVAPFDPIEFWGPYPLASPSPSPTPVPQTTPLGHVVLTQSGTLAVSPSPSIMTWDTATNLVGGIWSASPNPSRVTAPTGATVVTIAAIMPLIVPSPFPSPSPNPGTQIIIYKNGAEIQRTYHAKPMAGSINASGVFECVAGDYFEVSFGDASVNIDEGASWFAATFY